MKKYDIFFSCGFGYRGAKEVRPIGTRILVNANDGSVKNPPKDEHGKIANCYDCPCKRKAKRKEDMFFSEADHMRGSRPTGRYWTCAIAHTVEHIIDEKDGEQ